MTKFSTLLVASILCTGLAGCQTTGSSQDRQNSITGASMISEGASCNQIAHNIGIMDQIIVETGNTSNTSSYDTRQAVNSTLNRSSISPYITDITNAWRGSNSGNQLDRQQSSNAQREKSRLIGLFQQKKCVRSS
ncbi:MAG: hypothetical protein COA45_12610 [Zetaproteobacteria bacterium]|nr:MAG: hypothetical protein COA45_12610 [Zetaproteobacteria bacterium]